MYRVLVNKSLDRILVTGKERDLRLLDEGWEIVYEAGDWEEAFEYAMALDQAEAFVQAVASATGRLPLVYVHPTWANGETMLSGLSFGARITPDSILARCGLWVCDYHDSPEIPLAWATSGWRLWQYAGDQRAGRRARGRTRIIQGLDRCDRNLFNGDVAGLYRFWNAAT